MSALKRKSGGLKGLMEKAASVASVASVGVAMKRVAHGEIAPDPNQPRKEFDEEKLNELAGSIENQGIIESITVRVATDEELQILPDGVKYIIAFGERRWRAAAIAKLEYLDVVVKEFSAADLWLNQVAENTARENFTPIELMASISKAKTEFKMSGLEISKAIGLNQATISSFVVIAGSESSELFTEMLMKGVALRAVAELARLSKKHPTFVQERLKLISAESVTLDFVSKLKDLLEGGAKLPPEVTEGSSTLYDQFNTKETDGATIDGPLSDAADKDTDGPLSDASDKDTDGPLSDASDKDTDGPLSDAADKDGPLSDAADKDTDGPLSDAADKDTDGPLSDAADTDTDTDTDSLSKEEQRDWVGDSKSQGAGIDGFIKRPPSQATINILVRDKEKQESKFGRVNLGIKPNDAGLIPVEFEDGIGMVSISSTEISIIGFE